jgi:hypothetical protein
MMMMMMMMITVKQDYFQRRYESLNQYRTSPPFRGRHALNPFTNHDT